MSCSPQEFLSLAQKLCNSAEEIERRCSVSRAYYAALHWAKEKQDRCPEVHRDTIYGGTHEEVIQRFLQHTESTTAKRIGYMLRDMRNKRESADYELSGLCVESDAQYQISAAERVKKLVDTV